MTKDDYLKYYIQGTDHYLIPSTEFIEVLSEMSNWKNECLEQKQALIDIREYCKKINTLFWVEDDEPKYVSKDILQIIDKVLGDEKDDSGRN